MNEDRILAKAKKLGYTNLGKDNKEKIANLKEQLGIEDLDELESSLDGMLSEQNNSSEGFDDIDFLDEEFEEEVYSDQKVEETEEIVEDDSEIENHEESEETDLEGEDSKKNSDESKTKNENADQNTSNDKVNSENKQKNDSDEEKKDLEKKSDKKTNDEKETKQNDKKGLDKKNNEQNKNQHNKYKGKNQPNKPNNKPNNLGKNSKHNLKKGSNAPSGVKNTLSNAGKKASQAAAKSGKAIGNAIKKGVAKAGQALAKVFGAALKAVLSNPYVLLVLGIILLIIILILIISSFFDEYENNTQIAGYYDSTCNFNNVKVNYSVDVVSSIYQEALGIGIYTIELDEFIKGAALYYDLSSSYDSDEIKAMMIVLKTNVLSKGNYKSGSDIIYLNVLDVGYLPISGAKKSVQKKYDKLYEEIKEILYLPNTFNGTIDELGDTENLDFTPNNFKNKGSNYTEILNNVYNNENLKIYKLADNCSFITSSCDTLSINSTSLSKNEFVEKLKAYYSNSTSVGGKIFADNAGTIYDVATKNNINPELVVVRAVSEGFSPGSSKNNYWGMGCTNTGGYNACITYSSFSDGVLGFVQNIAKYDSVSSMMSKYAYIGANWYNPGSSGLGGCYYYEHIKGFMTSERANEVAKICGKTSTCNKSGGDCTATTDADQLAYSKWQVYKMSLTRQNIFGIAPDTCNSYTSDCTIYAQSDSRWGKKKLGKSSATMSGSGCAVTSIAIGISCSKTELTVENFDAGVFVDKLNKGNCFTDNGSITWGCGAISEIAPSVKNLGKTILTGLTNEQKTEKIKSYDLKNHFVLLHFKNDAHKRGHWVVYSSTSGDYYVTKDPAGGKITNQLISEIDSMVVYQF